MPAPVDLLNRVFGKLTVIERLEKMEKGYRWRCLCECGNVEDIAQYRLPYNASNLKRRGVAFACEACRHERVCEECGKTFSSRSAKACCSEACHIAHQRKQWREGYYRLVDSDPDYNKRRSEQIRQRAESDPEFAQVLVERSRRQGAKRSERRKTDPEFREHLNRQARETYRKLAETILARRRLRRALLTPEERQQFRLRWREKNRIYAMARREAIRRNPVKYLLYREYHKEAGRKSYERIMADPVRRAARQKRQQERNRIAELNKLLQIDEKLSKQNDTDNS